MDMTRSSFPLWVFFNLQLCVQFTGGSNARAHDQTWITFRQNHQYLSPRLRYITEDNQAWKSGGLSGRQRVVSNILPFYYCTI